MRGAAPLPITAESVQEAECLHDGLAERHSVTRDDCVVTIVLEGRDAPPLPAVLSAIEACLERHRLRPLEVELNGTSYTMCARAGA